MRGWAVTSLCGVVALALSCDGKFGAVRGDAGPIALSDAMGLAQDGAVRDAALDGASVRDAAVAFDGGFDGAAPTDAHTGLDAANPTDATPTDVGVDAHVPVLRLLVVTHSAGFRHGVVTRPMDGSPNLVEQVVSDIGVDLGVEVDALYSSADVSGFTMDRVDDYAGFLFYTTGELPFSDDVREAIVDRVELGAAGFVGLHSATDTYRAWPRWGEMIGATQYADLDPTNSFCECHPWRQAVNVVNEAPGDATVSLVPSPWRVTDEIYQFDDFSRSRVSVLLSLDTSSVNLALASRTDHDFALAWKHSYGSGRVFYLALGHEPVLFSDTTYLGVVREGLRWAMGL